MRYQMYGALIAIGLFAMTAMGNPALAASPAGGSSITLAQAATAPAPGAGVQPQTPGAPTTMPGPMMEHGKGTAPMMEHGKGMGPMMGGQGHSGPMAGTPPCPAGKTMSGTPPACK